MFQIGPKNVFGTLDVFRTLFCLTSDSFWNVSTPFFDFYFQGTFLGRSNYVFESFTHWIQNRESKTFLELCFFLEKQKKFVGI